MKKSIHEFQLDGLTGKPVNFAAFKGKKLMVVNVASECGLTPQYQQLQELYDNFKEHIVIVGCPANNFGGQEPGDSEQIREFCTTNYGIQFPLTQKISVKGKDQHSLYQFLTQEEKNGVADSEVSWNFQKYILDEEGYLIKVVAPTASPFDDEVLEALDINLGT